MLDDLKLMDRYVRGLHAFLRSPLSLEECRRQVRDAVARRGAAFLDLVERGVLPNPSNPYGRLLAHAGVEPGDLRRLVRDRGLDGALDALYDAGVYVTHDELRGRVPVRRGSLALDFSLDDTWSALDQPVAALRSGGSRGSGRVIFQSFESWHNQAIYFGAFVSAHGVAGRPAAIFYPPPPITTGLGRVLEQSKIRMFPERWDIPLPLSAQPERFKSALLTATTVAIGRIGGARTPTPHHLPGERVQELALWAAEKRGAGTPAYIAATPSSAARVCRSAIEQGMDISGTFFRMGGEPLTPAKAALLESVGATAACNYANGEIGGVGGIACADPAALGDVHACANRVAVQPHAVEGPAGTVTALRFTTLSPVTLLTAINLVTDDFGVVEERDCGCELGQLGLRTHFHSIRSREKLTGEGVTFYGETLVELVETVLPGRFGGGITDYQFVEEEVEGVTRLALRISPRLGPIVESDVADAVFGYLSASRPGGGAMASMWQSSGTFDVRREAPVLTPMSKVLPLTRAESLAGQSPSAAEAQ